MPLSSPRGGAPPGPPGPGRGPGAGGDRHGRETEPSLLEMFSGAAQEDLLGRGSGAVRVFLLGRCHPARQADLQEVRCSLHPDMVCHQLELFILPVVLRGPRLQVGRETVGEAEIQVGGSGMPGCRPGAGLLSQSLMLPGCPSGGHWEGPVGTVVRSHRVTCCLSEVPGSAFSPLRVVTPFLCLEPLNARNCFILDRRRQHLPEVCCGRCPERVEMGKLCSSFIPPQTGLGTGPWSQGTRLLPVTYLPTWRCSW